MSKPFIVQRSILLTSGENFDQKNAIKNVWTIFSSSINPKILIFYSFLDPIFFGPAAPSYSYAKYIF